MSYAYFSYLRQKTYTLTEQVAEAPHPVDVMACPFWVGCAVTEDVAAGTGRPVIPRCPYCSRRIEESRLTGRPYRPAAPSAAAAYPDQS